MAPSIVQNVTETVDRKLKQRVSDTLLKDTLNDSLLKEPLHSTGSLDTFPHDHLTPSTGTEFTSATQLSALLKAPNADQLIRDLAILSTLLLIIVDDSISKMCRFIPQSGSQYCRAKAPCRQIG
jgi:hypothetical protein